MIQDYARLAMGELRSRGLRSWLTMLGIFIGIAAVVSLIGLGEGLRVAVTSQFGVLGSDILTVQASGTANGPPGTGVVKPLSDTLAAKIARIGGVQFAINRYIKIGTMDFNRRQQIGWSVSMPIGAQRKDIEDLQDYRMQQGRILKDGDGRRVVLGSNFAKTDIFGKAISAGDRILLNGISYDVIGILAPKGSFTVDNAVLINEDTLLKDFGDDHSASLITVKVRDRSQIDAVQADIEKLLRKERDVKEGEEDFSVQSSQKALESLNSTLFAVQLFIYIIAGISLLVGGIGIMNTMYTSVLERTSDIGVMKAIGARNSTIFILFFLESGFLGMVGGIIGLMLGLILAYGLAFIGSLALGSDLIQANVSVFLLVGALLFSFVIGSAAGILPAMRAARLEPVEALNYTK